MFSFPAESQSQGELSSEPPELTGDGQKVYSGTWLRLWVGESYSGGRGSGEWSGIQVGQAGGLPTPVNTMRLLTSPFCPKAALGTHRQEHPGEEELLGRQGDVSGGGSGVTMEKLDSLEPTC